MSKNQLAVKGKNQFTEVTEILKNPASRAKLQNYIDEACRCKTKILDENESIKGLRDQAVEDLNLQPKMFNSLVGLYFNNNFEQKKDELDQLSDTIDALMHSNGIGNDNE